MARKTHNTDTVESAEQAQPVVADVVATDVVAPEAAPAEQPAAPERTADDIRAEIARIRTAFVGRYADRVAILEEAITAKRAEIAAARIVELQDSLPTITK